MRKIFKNLTFLLFLTTIISGCREKTQNKRYQLEIEPDGTQIILDTKTGTTYSTFDGEQQTEWNPIERTIKVKPIKWIE